MTTGIRRDGARAAALAHLAANGPTPRADLRGILVDRLRAKDASAYASSQLRDLESLGLVEVEVKVSLTPAGFDEVRRLHLQPREGRPS